MRLISEQRLRPVFICQRVDAHRVKRSRLHYRLGPRRDRYGDLCWMRATLAAVAATRAQQEPSATRAARLELEGGRQRTAQAAA
jgi:hypothetical protein